MTKVRVFTPPNGLAAGLDDWRGVDCAAAIRSAERFIATLSPRLLEDIDRALSVLDQARAHRGACDHGPAFDLETVYAQADALAGLANLVHRPGLGKIALSLCQLIIESDVRSDVIAIHIDALLLVRKDEAAWDGLAPELRRLAARVNAD